VSLVLASGVPPPHHGRHRASSVPVPAGGGVAPGHTGVVPVGPAVEVAQGFTRASVREYLRHAAATRAELDAALHDARARLEAATGAAQRVEALERRVGEWIVLHTVRRRAAAGTGPDVLDPPPPPTMLARLEELEQHLDRLRALRIAARAPHTADGRHG